MYRLLVIFILFVPFFSGIALSFADESNLKKQTPASSTTQAADSELQGVIISGVLHVIYGDPPPDSDGKSRMKFMLTDKQGQSWVLFFDKQKYWPAGGARTFNKKLVTVEGKHMPASETKTIRVESIQTE